MSNIEIGTRVRSFDWGRDLEGERACYVEGVVEAIDTEHFDCPRYKIRIEHRVFGGREGLITGEDFVYPPVNGTRTSLGRVANCVEVI